MKRCAAKPYDGQEKYIFVSYCHRDRAQVFPIIEQLVKDGYRIWYDEGIDPGSEWPEIIAYHLNGCAACIAFISENSLNSHNCRREINFALLKKKPFISVVLEEVHMSLGIEMQLSATQAIFKYAISNEIEFYNKLYSAKLLEICKGMPQKDIVVSKPEDYLDEFGDTFSEVQLKRDSFSQKWFVGENSKDDECGLQVDGNQNGNIENDETEINESDSIQTVSRTPIKLQIESLPNKQKYVIGEHLDTSGLSILAKYSDGTSENVTQDVSCTPYLLESLGSTVVNVNYCDIQTYFIVSVEEINSNKLKIRRNLIRIVVAIVLVFVIAVLSLLAYKLFDRDVEVYDPENNEILSADNFSLDLETLEIAVGDEGHLIALNTSKNKESVTWMSTDPGVAIVVDGMVIPISAGVTNIVATCDGITDICEVTVVGPQIKEIKIDSFPTKMEYYVGETVDVSGLVVKIEYMDGATKLIDSGFVCNCESFDMPGTYSVPVIIGSNTVTFDLDVRDIFVESISIKKMPDRINCFVNDILDMSGLELEVTLSDGTTRVISEGYTYSSNVFSETGTHTVEIEYCEKTASFSVFVQDVEIDNINVCTTPKKLVYYVGEELDTSGLVLSVEYNNGKIEYVDDGYICSPTELTSNGPKAITVEYEGYRSSFNVNVYDNDIVNVAIDKNPNKLEYAFGDKLDLTGLELLVKYRDGNYRIVKDGFACKTTSLIYAGEQQIVVEYEGFFVYFNVFVNQKKVSITLDPVGGVCDTLIKEIISGEMVGNLPTPQRDCYSFVGWYTSALSGNKVTESMVVYSDMVIYARWTQNPESNWVGSIPDGAVQSQSKTVYSYRDKIYTTSSTDSMDGWTLFDKQSSYSDWSDGEWTTIEPTESSIVRVVDTRTVVDQEGYTEYVWYVYKYYDPKTGTRYLYSEDPRILHGEDAEFEYFEMIEYYPADGVWWFTKSSTEYPEVSHNEWYYQTRTETVTYHFYQWGRWSDYNDVVVYSSDSREVRTKVLYKYIMK